VIGDVNPNIPMAARAFFAMFEMKIPVKFFREKQEAVRWFKSINGNNS